jgi:hypothetical protein
MRWERTAAHETRSFTNLSCLSSEFHGSNTIVSEPQNPRVYTELASHFCRFWQKFLDDQAIEFTAVEWCGSLLEPCFQAAMVELLTLQGKC